MEKQEGGVTQAGDRVWVMHCALWVLSPTSSKLGLRVFKTTLILKEVLRRATNFIKTHYKLE